MLEPGHIVEKYRIESMLGEGGMAIVYLVTHTTLGTKHALKVLTITAKSIKERLVDEGRVQATLLHPNVVRVIDVVNVDGQPGLVMDYVDGPDLDEWIPTAKPDAATAEAVFRGIVAGVKAAHDRGLIHRDLKPANILLATEADGTLVPKVADFGLSKALTGEQKVNRTRSGMPMGTPAYMSPEQIEDAAGVDERADLFSLGCILHELVTHETAYAGDDVVTIFNAVLADERESLPTLRPGVPAHLVAAVDGCLVADRDERVASCDELLALLDGQGKARGMREVSITLPTLPTLPNRPPPWLLGTLAALGALGIVAAGAGVIGSAMWLSSTSTELGGPTICGQDTWSQGSLGWVRHPGLIPPGRGRTWRVPRQADVHANAPGEDGHEEVACVIPAGSQLVVGDKRNSWLEVLGANLTVPEPEPSDEEPNDPEDAEREVPQPVSPKTDPTPIPSGDCAGKSGLVGYINVKLLIQGKGSTWHLNSAKDVLAGRPERSNKWRADWEPVCTLASGTAVKLLDKPVRVKGEGTWVPVYAAAVMVP